MPAYRKSELWLSSLKLARMAALSLCTTALSSAIVLDARTLRMNCFTVVQPHQYCCLDIALHYPRSHIHELMFGSLSATSCTVLKSVCGYSFSRPIFHLSPLLVRIPCGLPKKYVGWVHKWSLSSIVVISSLIIGSTSGLHCYHGRGLETMH